MISQWNRRERRLQFETTGSLSRADSFWVYHSRYRFSGRESESRGLPYHRFDFYARVQR
jgi:hypothetical protein